MDGIITKVIKQYESPEQPAIVEVTLKQPASVGVWPRPIPVSERLPGLLPTDGSLALYYSEEVMVCIGHRYNDGRFDDFDWYLAVLASEPEYYRSDEKFWKVAEYRDCEDRVELADSTHWMPKPPLPPKPE